MQAAASQTVEFGKANAWRRQNRLRNAPQSDASLEVVRPIQSVPYADVQAASVTFEEVMPRERSELLGRVVNIVVAGLALTILSPFIALIAIAIKLTSRGPVIYSQTRVGVDRRYHQLADYDRRAHDFGGRLFQMFKFRTMRVDAEPDGNAVWASQSDPRVTPIGRVLRRMRLDELPQLYNVLRGDMNIVGPRPERPTIFARLRQDIPQYQFRQRVKPGITGWAQINQSYDECLDDVRRKVDYDLEYMRRQCLVEDLRIMSMTVPVMLFRKGGW
jgi:lipopolysaccharide/colanic/teichoic acid biosynthesis glycosyltransferase